MTQFDKTIRCKAMSPPQRHQFHNVPKPNFPAFIVHRWQQGHTRWLGKGTKITKIFSKIFDFMCTKNYLLNFKKKFIVVGAV